MSIVNEYDNLFDLALTFIPDTCDPLDLEQLIWEEDMERQPRKIEDKKQQEAPGLKTAKKSLKPKEDELSKFQKTSEKKNKQTKAPNNLNPVIRRSQDPKDLKKKKNRAQSQKVLKPVLPQGYKRIAEYIRDYQKTHQNYYPLEEDPDISQRLQSRQSQIQNRYYQDNLQNKTNNFLNFSIESGGFKENNFDEYELLQEIDTSVNKSISPQKKGKIVHKKPWDDSTNPYANGWTREVLKNHYNVEIRQLDQKKPNMNNISTMSKKWVVRKTRAKTDHQLKEQTKNYAQEVPPTDVQEIIDQAKQSEEQVEQIDLVELLNTIYNNYDGNNQQNLQSKKNINMAQRLPLFSLNIHEMVEKASYVNKMLLVK